METIHPSRSVHPFRSIIVVNLISFTEQNMIMHDIKIDVVLMKLIESMKLD